MMGKSTDYGAAFKQSRDMLGKQLLNSQKLMESFIEFGSTAYQGNQAIAKNMFECYVSNVSEAFDDVKKLTKATDIGEFYQIASANMVSSAERWNEQSKRMAEITGQVMKDTGEAGRQAYSKGFPFNDQ